MANMEDHLGNKYSSQLALCQAYGVTPTLFRKRVTRGWSVKEALLGRREKVVYDEATTFGSIKEFKEHYGITDFAYTDLSQKYDNPRDIVEAFYEKKLKAPNGKLYNSYTQMCKDYGVNYYTYRARRRKGLSLKDALEGGDWAGGADDHYGNHYNSTKEMCEVYGVTYHHFAYYKKLGHSLEECLRSKDKTQDHLGVTFNTVEEMCNAYGVEPATFYKRKRKGVTLEECLVPNKQDELA